MLSKTFSATILGLNAYLVEVEVNATGQGEYSALNIVGLPDTAVKESVQRIKSAINNSGYSIPQGENVVNLAPADIKKEGAIFDLPIAAALLGAGNIINRESLSKVLIIGELGLDGKVRPIKGILPIVLEARKFTNIKAIIVPEENAIEAASVANNQLYVYSVSTLYETIQLLNKEIKKQRVIVNFNANDFPTDFPDFSEVKGQYTAKRALEISAAGGHNCLMIGPPGTGKSMLAKRLPSILPPLTEEESIESSTIHSVVGGLRDGKLLKLRPFRAPHHTISDAGLVGGGHNIPKPGEITLAHNGVLFLDELPEFKRSALEVMRQPLENREVTISRVSGVFTYPAKFILIAALNPCPCGHYGNYRKNCTCSHSQIARYRSKISGPLLDRIDLHIEVPELSEKELFTDAPAESSYEIRNRVMKARKKQELRFQNKYSMLSNSDMTSKELKEFCKFDKETERFIRHIIIKKQLSARSYDRILKVARTIADLAEKDEIDLEDITEAIQYRNPELLS